MVDVWRVADLLVSHAVETHGDAIDLIACYGSYVKGTATAFSDLDIFYTPAEGLDPPVARVALVEGVLFDFWPVRWPRLQAAAEGRGGSWSRFAGVVHYARPLHASDAGRSRLEALKQSIVDLQQPPAHARMVGLALQAFTSVLAHWSNVRIAAAGGDLADVRHAGWAVVHDIRECLTLANQVLPDQAGLAYVEQLEALPRRPDDLRPLIETVATSPDPAAIASAVERLVMGTRAVLREFQQALPPRQAPDGAAGINYPELNAGMGKVLSACQRRRPIAASMAATFAQFDLSLMLSDLDPGSGQADFNLYGEYAGLYRRIGLPELMAAAGDMDGLAAGARQFDERIAPWLQSRGVDLQQYPSLEAFERSLRDA